MHVYNRNHAQRQTKQDWTIELVFVFLKDSIYGTRSGQLSSDTKFMMRTQEAWIHSKENDLVQRTHTESKRCLKRWNKHFGAVRCVTMETRDITQQEQDGINMNDIITEK